MSQRPGKQLLDFRVFHRFAVSLKTPLVASERVGTSLGGVGCCPYLPVWRIGTPYVYGDTSFSFYQEVKV